MADKIENVILRYVIDNASLAGTQRGTQDLVSQLDLLKYQTAQAGLQAQDTGAKLRQTFGDPNVQAAIKDYNQRLEETKQKYKELSVIAKEYGADSRDSLGGGGSGGSFSGFTAGRGLRYGGDLATRLGSPELGGALRIGADLGYVSDAVKKVGESLTGLPGLLGSVATEGLAMGGSLGAVLAIAAPLAIAVGAVALVFLATRDNADTARAGLQALMDTQDAYYAALEKYTTQQAQEEVDKLTRDNIFKERQKNEQLDIFKGLQGGDPNLKGLDGDAMIQKYKGLIKIGEDPAVAATVKKYDDLSKQILDNGTQTERLKGALKDGAFAANDEADALKKGATEYANLIKQREAELKVQEQLNKLLETGTVKQLQARIDQDQSTADLLWPFIRDFPSALLETEKGRELLKQLTAQFNDLNGEIKKLEFGKVVAKFKELADAASKSLVDGFKKVADIGKDIEDRNKKAGDVITRQNEDIAKIHDDAARRRIDIDQKYADKQIEIAQKAVDQATEALYKLQDKYNALSTGLSRDLEKQDRDFARQQLTDQIKYQREEVQLKTDHLRRLQDITKSTASQDEQALLMRNFLQLRSSKQSIADQVSQENTRFARAEQDKITQLEQTKQDQLRAYIEQRKERLITFAQANADATKQYNLEIALQQRQEERQLELAKDGHDKELVALRNKVIDELKIRRDGSIKELGLIYQTEKAKQDLLNANLAQVKGLLKGTSQQGSLFNFAFNYNANRRAFGGMTDRPALVNDGYPGQRESVNGMQFMGGMGVYVPFQPSYVNPGGAKSSTNTFYITSHDPQGVRREIVDVLERVMR